MELRFFVILKRSASFSGHSRLRPPRRSTSSPSNAAAVGKTVPSVCSARTLDLRGWAKPPQKAPCYSASAVAAACDS